MTLDKTHQPHKVLRQDPVEVGMFDPEGRFNAPNYGDAVKESGAVVLNGAPLDHSFHLVIIVIGAAGGNLAQSSSRGGIGGGLWWTLLRSEARRTGANWERVTSEDENGGDHLR